MATFTAHIQGKPEIGVYRMKNFDRYVQATHEQFMKAKDSVLNELLPDLRGPDVEKISSTQWNPPVVFKYRPGFLGL